MLATLLLSQGVPMILGGDEIGRTQRGNNNAYAQDNVISWVDWTMDDEREKLLEFTQKLVEIRRAHPNLHRRKFFQDRSISPGKGDRTIRGRRVQDICWVRPDGQEMTEQEWTAGWVRCLGLRLSGRTLDDVNAVGEPIVDDAFLLLLNPHTEPIDFYMPKGMPGESWEVLLDTACPDRSETVSVSAGKPYRLTPRTFALLREVEPEV
jgi:glycogen operon protein